MKSRMKKKPCIILFDQIKEKKKILFILVNDLDDVYKNLTRIPHTQIYTQQNILPRYHYKNNSRIGNLIIIVDPGYELHRNSFRMFIYYFLFFIYFLSCFTY